jgi:hypothetical protein
MVFAFKLCSRKAPEEHEADLTERIKLIGAP